MTIDDNMSGIGGIRSLLDTDLYKLTMQCAVLKHFPDAQVTYTFTNRTPTMQLNQKAASWLQEEIIKLGELVVSDDEISWLEKTCPYFGAEYLKYLKNLRLQPSEQVHFRFTPNEGSENSTGAIELQVSGLWAETILYEIPLLALISEAYFRFVDTDWNHDGQIQQAMQKGLSLLEAGCVFSEFGSRRRRDLKTHESVMKGLIKADEEAKHRQWKGVLSGTSNVHLAMKFGVKPVGTVAHEWFMGIAALQGDYSNANEMALRYWVATYGPGVLAIALTDTFGTPAFLKAFSQPVPQALLKSEPASYAQTFTGVRQDSGDPLEFVKMMRSFYTEQGVHDAKTIIYSDSLDVKKCIEYKKATEEAGLTPSFGVGTHFTNDFKNLSNNEKSVPLNIVIKLSAANGNSAVKLSDNAGKNMGPEDLVARVKAEVGYTEKTWKEGDEAHRWDEKSS